MFHFIFLWSIALNTIFVKNNSCYYISLSFPFFNLFTLFHLGPNVIANYVSELRYFYFHNIIVLAFLDCLILVNIFLSSTLYLSFFLSLRLPLSLSLSPTATLLLCISLSHSPSFSLSLSVSLYLFLTLTFCFWLSGWYQGIEFYDFSADKFQRNWFRCLPRKCRWKKKTEVQ